MENEVIDVSELDALEHSAAELDAEGGDMGPAPDGAGMVGPDPVQETAALLGVCVGMVAPLLPYLPAIYTDEVVGRLAAAYVPVAEKHGWGIGGEFFERWGPEIVLAGTVLPLAMATKSAHQAWAAERAAEKRAEKAAADEAARRQKAAAEQMPAEPVQSGMQAGGLVIGPSR